MSETIINNTPHPFLDRLFKHKVIVNCDRDPYLYRWYVFRTKHVALFIHKFVRSDEDRALHDHPWPFLVIPIWRGYIEHSDRLDPILGQIELLKESTRIPMIRRVRPFLCIRFRGTDYRHRVELFKDPKRFEVHVDAGGKVHQEEGLPSWSLFFRFTECRTWGFWLKEGFTPWNKFWQDKCE